MLRYNNHQSTMSKPVDFYRPLTVDVSVEYELPKEVSPPPGSAPLLIIHPSAYFRSKVNQPLSSSTSSSLLASHSNKVSSKNSSSSRQQHQPHDLNSSLFYSKGSLSGNGSSSFLHGNPASHSMTSSSNNSSNHIKGLRSSSSATSGSSITRSRSVIMNGCDVPFRNNSSSTAANMNLTHHQLQQQQQQHGKYDDEFFNANPTSNFNSSKVSATKKLATAAQQFQQQQHHHDRLNSYSSNYGLSSSNNNNHSSSSNMYGVVPMEPSTDLEISTTAGSAITFGIGGVGVGGGNSNAGGGGGSSGIGHSSTATSSASNKRLRMMNQHQNSLYNPGGTQQPIEPLNLAITPSASNPLLNSSSSSTSATQSSSSFHNNFSTFIGNSYKAVQQQQQQHHHQANNNNYMITGLGLNYGSTFPSNHHRTALTGSNHLYASASAAQSARFPKECPIPVDKGSGSDSGVCSENDSDVSPPMAPFSSHHLRRSTILSQELPTSGCYCCCCPSSSSSSSRKNSSSSSAGGSHNKGNSSKSSSFSSPANNNSNQHYQQHPLGAHNPNKQLSSHQNASSSTGGGLNGSNSTSSGSSSSIFNYGLGSLNTAISMSMMTMPAGAEGHFTAHHHNNSLQSMDASSVALGTTPLDLDSTYRKWFGGSSVVGPGLVIDGNSSSLGRWFQV